MSEIYMEEDEFTTDDENLEYQEGDSLAEETEENSGSIFDELEEIDFAALGIHAEEPTEAKPGSEQKVLTLAARYAAGLPLWHNQDRYDHAPNLPGLSGLKFDA